jgi:hypothetical protein
MKDHIETLIKQALPVPLPNPAPVVTIHNEQTGAMA